MIHSQMWTKRHNSFWAVQSNIRVYESQYFDNAYLICWIFINFINSYLSKHNKLTQSCPTSCLRTHQIGHLSCLPPFCLFYLRLNNIRTSETMQLRQHAHQTSKISSWHFIFNLQIWRPICATLQHVFKWWLPQIFYNYYYIILN